MSSEYFFIFISFIPKLTVLPRFTIIILGGISYLLNKNSTNKNDLILIIFEQLHEINEGNHTLVSKNYSQVWEKIYDKIYISA
jgi:hypothetical protein